jgi:hypothetical protein
MLLNIHRGWVAQNYFLDIIKYFENTEIKNDMKLCVWYVDAFKVPSTDILPEFLW